MQAETASVTKRMAQQRQQTMLGRPANTVAQYYTHGAAAAAHVNQVYNKGENVLREVGIRYCQNMTKKIADGCKLKGSAMRGTRP